MNCVLRAWGELKNGFGVLALDELCFEGMGGVEKGGLRCLHRVECVLRAWGQLKRGFEVLALGEMCCEGMGGVEKGV